MGGVEMTAVNEPQAATTGKGGAGAFSSKRACCFQCSAPCMPAMRVLRAIGWATHSHDTTRRASLAGSETAL